MKAIFISLILFLFIHIDCCFSGGLGAPLSVNANIILPQETLRNILNKLDNKLLVRDRFVFSYLSQNLEATTTIEQRLQSYLDGLMDNALGAQTAIVCMDPVSGKVLAMSGFDRNRPLKHIWTDELVPAASLFKIVTAAGALELYNLFPSSVFYFNGGKHTLYKYQLRDKINKYSTKVTLKEAFAQSINPVFGKIGQRYLKRQGLILMARRFLWQTDIPFELPVKKSCLSFNDTRFNIAEVASGFNKQTRLTALHAALMASGIINGGVVMAPFFINIVEDNANNIVYQSAIYPLKRAINPKTASFLKELMISTIKRGTAKKAFRRVRRDKILKTLIIGGKTGTIDNEDHSIRYDLFSGFACRNDLTKCIALGIFVAHEKVLGTRASEYARMAIRKYFEIQNN